MSNPSPRSKGTQSDQDSSRPDSSLHRHHYPDQRDSAEGLFRVKKACHTPYTFDAKGEKDVTKWLRPAPKQCKIYWDHNARTYEPDFVIETVKMVYLAEIKADNQLTAQDVLEKGKAAYQYCKHTSEQPEEWRKRLEVSADSAQ